MTSPRKKPCTGNPFRHSSEGGLVDEALLTDLYELAMLDAYVRYGNDAEAVFELYFRALPPQRGFLVVAGLTQVVEYLERLRFTDDDLDFLRASGRFGEAFIERLAAFRFTGDLDAIAEGTIVFPDEPVLRVTAPLQQAQFVESRLLNLVHFQTLVASKAARMRLAAPGKQLLDFGFRRAHGAEAGVFAARAAYIAGFAGTATVEAGRRFGIPLFGTMAHSFIEAHATEEEAFEAFARARPDGVVLLIDTYDVERAAHRVVAVARRLAGDGITVRGVRIDSGDLGALARTVRGILDAGGLSETTIFASGGLDENDLVRLVDSGAPIDGYGLGTQLAASADAPALDCGYKLVSYDGMDRAKLSPGKANWPGAKQVWRTFDDAGRMHGDLLAAIDTVGEGMPLLEPVLRGGRRVAELPDLDVVREHTRAQLAQLPQRLAALEHVTYPVAIDPLLRERATSLRARES
jgi:nicotinate phosphoribosyltransferase